MVGLSPVFLGLLAAGGGEVLHARVQGLSINILSI